MKPVAEFIDQRGMKFTCQQVSQRADGIMTDLPRHFKCTLGQYRRQFSLYYSQGSAYTEAPTCSEVLSAVAEDAASYENAGSFENWAAEFGYDTDSRKAEKIYRTVKRQAESLKRVLGADNYAYLLNDVMQAERDAA